jgi:hypothetical protein
VKKKKPPKPNKRAVVQRVADQIVGELKARGFVVHRTDAVHSASVYLKLDYGVANTIRISDHTGSGGRLDFRFNILSHVRGSFTTLMEDGTDRHWYGWGDVGRALKDIEAFRERKRAMLGDEYGYLMERNAYFARTKPQGMWIKARRV